MRKLILISALLLASASAHAGDTRSLSLAGLPTVTTTVSTAGTITEAPKPIAQVSVRLAQAATTASDAAPVQVQPPATTTAAPVQAPAPVQNETPATTAITNTATTTPAPTTETKTTTESRPKATKKVRRVSDEQKARRIAAKYGVYW